MNKFFQEFKQFAIKGNMLDMAVGIVIGTAFNNVVGALVSKVVMPPLSLLTDDVHLANRKYVLREAQGSIEEIAIGYGALIEVLIDFLIISMTIFVVIKVINRFKSKAEDLNKAQEVQTPKDIELLSSMERLMTEQNELLKGLKK